MQHICLCLFFSWMLSKFSPGFHSPARFSPLTCLPSQGGRWPAAPGGRGAETGVGRHLVASGETTVQPLEAEGLPESKSLGKYEAAEDKTTAVTTRGHPVNTERPCSRPRSWVLSWALACPKGDLVLSPSPSCLPVAGRTELTFWQDSSPALSSHPCLAVWGEVGWDPGGLVLKLPGPSSRDGVSRSEISPEIHSDHHLSGDSDTGGLWM